MKKLLLWVVLSCGFTSSASAQLSSGLLARYPFDGNTTDVTGNIGTSTATNATYGPDFRNQPTGALRLTGTGEVAIEPNGLLDFGTTGNFTFSVTFRTLSSGTQAFFSNKGNFSATSTSTLSQGWSFGFDNSLVGKLYLDLVRDNFYNGTLALATQANFNDGLWHTAAVVVDRDNRQIRLFVDGTAQPLLFVNTNENYGAVAGSTFTLSRAYSQVVNLTPGYSVSQTNTTKINNRFGLGYNGSLDEARFYNRALTATDIQMLHSLALATAQQRAAAALVQVYPNPAPSGQLTVRLAPTLQGAQLRIYTALGQQVLPDRVVASAQETHLMGLATGLYLLVVRSEGQTLTRHFQVN